MIHQHRHLPLWKCYAHNKNVKKILYKTSIIIVHGFFRISISIHVAYCEC